MGFGMNRQTQMDDMSPDGGNLEGLGCMGSYAQSHAGELAKPQSHAPKPLSESRLCVAPQAVLFRPSVFLLSLIGAVYLLL